ncbi:protein transport protein S31 [Lecanora helva]
MVGLRDIPRTATFAWSPGASAPFLATGTKAGAVDEGFSNDTQLELWDLDLDRQQQSQELQPTASISTDSRFNDIAWTIREDEQSKGVIAGALENGSLDLWDADRLLKSEEDAFMSRTSKHSGAIKALQFNAFRSELLATVGAKGELFISDLNNVGSPFRMGNAVARADDFDCLDWNKRTAHILATGSSGGTMTVWDVKNKRESLTLNNMGRKPVSAIAWDPVKTTRLITSIPNDTDPVILVWDLRNANAPEKVLRGHDGGVLSLSWCTQDSDLLLSCGKDNRNICWNPQTGESLGEFPVVTNWTFQTRWNPHNPGLMATASFDGKITIESIQSTRAETDRASGTQPQSVDDDDFFNKAQTQPQGPRFTLKKAPKWLQRPCSASFGFGGKVVSLKTSTSETSKRSMIRISFFAVDDEIVASTESFEAGLKENDLNKICESRIANAKNNADKADWKVIKTLTSKNPRGDLVDYLGFSSQDDEAADGISKLSINGSKEENAPTSKQPSAHKSNRLSTYFDNSVDGDNFLSELAATKGAKTNNPFQLYSGSESESDRRITRALLLGEFEKALNVCLQEDRMSDAFMIAICGGQTCIEKAQKAYFSQKSEGPNYLRLLASVAGKNLWDLVHNVNLESWKEVMASLCTYADSKEFPDLCEALGDRLEEHMKASEENADFRKDASFCYLAGSKLEKVVDIWLAELRENEIAGLQDTSKDSSFSVHARSLQSFIEKVTVFREVTHYEDSDRNAASDWKLAPLYDKYVEYADIASAQGQLQIAERYLELLPRNYPAADVARKRVHLAVQKATPQPTSRQPTTTTRAQTRVPQAEFQQQDGSTAKAAGTPSNPYAPAMPAKPQNPYAPTGSTYGAPGYSNTGGYQQGQSQQQPRPYPGMVPPPSVASAYQNQSVGPPPRNHDAPASIPPPSKASNMTNWNDMPEDFFKPPTSRRGTPGVGANPSSTYQPTQPPNMGSNFGPPQKSTPPLGPPPKGPLAPPPRMSSPATNPPQSFQQPERPSSVANAYAPPQNPNGLPVQQQSTIPRGPSPYNPPPSAAPPSNRYAPAQPPQPDPSPIQQYPPPTPGVSQHGPPPANPYAPQQNTYQQQQQQQQPPPSSMGPPSSSAPPPGPPPQQGSRPGTSQSQRRSAPPSSKYPPGDRSHISPNARPVYDILNADMQRVKAKAPSSFKAQVNDTEKRLNILFDHLNNEDLLKPDTVQNMAELAQAIQARDYEQAQGIHVEIMTNKTDECGNWMVGVKRLIAMSRATP